MSPGSPPPAAMSGPDAPFWQTRFEARATPWDRGAVNPQLESWLRSGQLQPGQLHPGPGAVDSMPGGASGRVTRVLVPGCGSGHEVVALAAAGFDVTAVDFAPAAAELTRNRLRSLLHSPAGARMVHAEVIEADVLSFSPPAPFDAVYEQTCLCALYPDDWRRYADQLFGWLRPGGSLFALFVQLPRQGSRTGFIEGPPYHCDVNGMRALFPAGRWQWPKPPYAAIAHPMGLTELAVVLTRC